jgi:hypothetical protein
MPLGHEHGKTQRIESDTFILGSFGLQNQAAYGKAIEAGKFCIWT